MRYIYIYILISTKILYSQNDLNIYQDFTGESSLLYSSLIDEYIGEYQWFHKPENGIYWLDQSSFEDLYFSWKIEVLSFPFVPDLTRTFASDSITRILQLAENYNVGTNNWATVSRVAGDTTLSRQLLNSGFLRPFSINQYCTLISNFFTKSGPVSSSRIFLPHSILRHTLYIHQSTSNNSSKVDSVFFIVDHTRGRMRHYPFVPANIDSLTSTEASHDISIQQKFYLIDSLNAVANNLLTPNYFSSEVDLILLDNGEDELCNIPNPTMCPLMSNEPEEYARPADYSYNQFRLLDSKGNLPAGYIEQILWQGQSPTATYECIRLPR